MPASMVGRWPAVAMVMAMAMLAATGAMAQDAPPRPTPGANDGADDDSARGEPETPPLEDLLVSILILDVSLVDIPPGIEKVLIGPISAEVANDESLDVLTGEDVRRLSKLDADRAFAGCDQTSCASEIADALGAELVIFSTLGRLGDAYLFNMNLIDTSTATNLGRVSASADEISDLRDVVVVATKDLMGRYRKSVHQPKAQALVDEVTENLRAAAPAEGGDAPADAQPQRPTNVGPPPWASTAWVVGGVAIAGAVFLGGLGFDVVSPTSFNYTLDVGDFVGPTLMLGAIALGIVPFVYNPFTGQPKSQKESLGVSPSDSKSAPVAGVFLDDDESEGLF